MTLVLRGGLYFHYKRMKRKLIYIEWADATSPQQVWWTKDECIDWARDDDYWISQVGWILKEDKKFILLSSQKSNTHSNNAVEMIEQFSHIQKIPKTWIRKKINLTDKI